MAHAPLFDIIKASKNLEQICAKFVASHSDHVTLDWLRLSEAHPRGCGLSWLLRDTENGRYLHTQMSLLSREALVVLGSVGSRRKLATSQIDEFSKAAESLIGVLAYGLKMPARHWSRPRPCGRRQPK